MLNYKIDPDILLPFVPAGTQIDEWQGDAYISLTPLCEVLVGHSYYSGRTMIESRLQRRDGKFQINF